METAELGRVIPPKDGVGSWTLKQGGTIEIRTYPSGGAMLEITANFDQFTDSPDVMLDEWGLRALAAAATEAADRLKAQSA